MAKRRTANVAFWSESAKISSTLTANLKHSIAKAVCGDQMGDTTIGAEFASTLGVIEGECVKGMPVSLCIIDGIELKDGTCVGVRRDGIKDGDREGSIEVC